MEKALKLSTSAKLQNQYKEYHDAISRSISSSFGSSFYAGTFMESSIFNFRKQFFKTRSDLMKVVAIHNTYIGSDVLQYVYCVRPIQSENAGENLPR